MCYSLGDLSLCACVPRADLVIVPMISRCVSLCTRGILFLFSRRIQALFDASRTKKEFIVLYVFIAFWCLGDDQPHDDDYESSNTYRSSIVYRFFGCFVVYRRTRTKTKNLFILVHYSYNAEYRNDDDSSDRVTTPNGLRSRISGDRYLDDGVDLCSYAR